MESIDKVKEFKQRMAEAIAFVQIHPFNDTGTSIFNHSSTSTNLIQWDGSGSFPV